MWYYSFIRFVCSPFGSVCSLFLYNTVHCWCLQWASLPVYHVYVLISLKQNEFKVLNCYSCWI